MITELFGQLSWLGHDLPVAAPNSNWFDLLENFTGLTVERQTAPKGVPVLSILDNHHVLVNGGDLRAFPSLENLKAWLFLTVSDVMITDGGFTTFHAAGLALDGSATLFSGPPWSGKSSFAFEAQRSGLEVIGDDQVCVDAPSGMILPLPRPLKRRLVSDGSERLLSPQALRAQLDDEFVGLEPRRTAALPPPEQRYAVGKIFHLERHSGAGVDVRTLQKSEARLALLNQIRSYHPKYFLANAAAATQMLASLPNFCMSVGDGEIPRALDLVRNLN